MKPTLNLFDFDQIRSFWKTRYRLYVKRYTAYTKLRGFQSINDWPFHRRGFIECWAAPGFHIFWQIWNPGIAYFVFRLYVQLSGKRNWIIATLLAFEINGLIHSFLFYIISGQWSYTIPILFFLFAVLTIVSKKLENVLNQKKWPRIVNTAVNSGLVIFSYDVCFKLNKVILEYVQISI